MPPNFILTLSCEDKPGIVATVTTALANLGANIIESNQFWDRASNRFFMRVAFAGTEDLLEEHIQPALAPAVERFSMAISLFNADRRPKIIVMVSKHDHALLHLLYQIRVNWLKAEVVAIVSNHEDASLIAERNNIRFHHLPVQRTTRWSRRKSSCGSLKTHRLTSSFWRGTCRFCRTIFRSVCLDA